jgi:hypothetical protein
MSPSDQQFLIMIVIAVLLLVGFAWMAGVV